MGYTKTTYSYDSHKNNQDDPMRQVDVYVPEGLSDGNIELLVSYLTKYLVRRTHTTCYSFHQVFIHGGAWRS